MDRWEPTTMERGRLDAILDRPAALLDETDDAEKRKELREIRQLGIGVRESQAPDDDGN